MVGVPEGPSAPGPGEAESSVCHHRPRPPSHPHVLGSPALLPHELLKGDNVAHGRVQGKRMKSL